MAQLTGYLVTFNCGRSLVDADYLAASLHEGLSKRDAPPELIIIALEEIAPISYSFLGGSFLAPYFDQLSVAVQGFAASWDQQYESVLASNVGMTAIMLFALPQIADRIKWLETGGVGVGRMDMGNKGGCGIRLGYETEIKEEMELSFVAAHLASGEEECQRRIEDWKGINEGLVFGKATKASTLKARKSSVVASQTEEAEHLLTSATDFELPRDERAESKGMFSPRSHLFFAGDLNFRTSDSAPGPDDHKRWPQSGDSPSEPTHYSQLLKRDQLIREKGAGRVLHSLQEEPVTFPPTYKYSSDAQKEAARRAKALSKQPKNDGTDTAMTKDADVDWLWAKHRYPSFCDRILFTKPPFPGTQPVIHKYTSLPLQPTSDHQPVALHFSVPLKALPQGGDDTWVKVPFKIRPDWQARRSTARQKEIAVGIAAYLAQTWEGEALLVGTLLAIIGGWAILRSLAM